MTAPKASHPCCFLSAREFGTTNGIGGRGFAAKSASGKSRISWIGVAILLVAASLTLGKNLLWRSTKDSLFLLIWRWTLTVNSKTTMLKHRETKSSVDYDVNSDVFERNEHPEQRESLAQNSKIPQQIHIGYLWKNKQIKGIQIQFVTQDPGTPIVSYGKGNHYQDSQMEGATVARLQASDFCGPPSNSTDAWPSQYLHSVPLMDLEPNTRYEYQVGIAMGQGVIWKEDIFHFQMAVANQSSSQSWTRYWVYSEQGVPSLHMPAAAWTVQAILQELVGKIAIAGTFGPEAVNVQPRRLGHSLPFIPPWTHHHHSPGYDNINHTSVPIQSVHILGGLSLARGKAEVWEEWWNSMQQITTQIPLMTAIGTSEYDTTSGQDGGECGKVWKKQFSMPINDTKHEDVYWYSYEDGPHIHMIVLSTEHDLGRGSSQFLWFQDELSRIPSKASKDRKWIVIEMHRPMYHSQAVWEDNARGLKLRRLLENSAWRHKVDLVLSGHYHSYFRSCEGLFQSMCDNGGPTYITVGSAGASPFGPAHFYDAQWAEQTIAHQYGYGRITANDNNLQFDWIPVHENQTDISPMDQIALYKT